MLDGDRSIKTLHARNDLKAGAAKKRKGEELSTSSNLNSDISLLSTEKSADDDLSMDSASESSKAKPMDESKAGTGTPRVCFTLRNPASSADDPAPSPLAGGG
jgi:hypothetical protein